MSLDYTVHVGPYIEAEPIIKKEKSKSQYKYCSNRQCSAYDTSNQAGRYCGYCKSELQHKEEIYEVGPDPYELIGERLMEWSGFMSLGKNSNHYFCANSDWKGETESFDPKFEHVLYDLTDLDIQKEIKKFSKFFEEEIKILGKHYKKVSVRWGVLNTVS